MAMTRAEVRRSWRIASSGLGIDHENVGPLLRRTMRGMHATPRPAMHPAGINRGQSRQSGVILLILGATAMPFVLRRYRMPMKLRGILSLVAMAGLTGAASAADIYQPPPPIETPIYTPTSVYNWSGFYLGVNGGTVGARPSGKPDLLIGDISTQGWFVGGQIGANCRQRASAGAFMERSCGAASRLRVKSLPYYGDTTVRHKLDWFGTARRVGFAMNNVMHT